MINFVGDTVVYEIVYGSILKNNLITHNTNSARLSPGGVISAYNYCFNFFEKPNLISYMCSKYTLSEDLFTDTDRTPKITQYVTDNNSKIFQSINSKHINNFDIYSNIKEKIKQHDISVLYDMGFGTLDSIESIISILLKKACTIIVYTEKYTECRGAHYLIIDSDNFCGPWENYKVDNLIVLKNNKVDRIYNKEYNDGFKLNSAPSYSINNNDIAAIVCGLLAGGIASDMDLIQNVEFINSVLDVKLNKLDYICINKDDLPNKNDIVTVKLEDSDIDATTIRMLNDKSAEGDELYVYTNRKELLPILQNFNFISKVFLSRPTLNLTQTPEKNIITLLDK